MAPVAATRIFPHARLVAELSPWLVFRTFTYADRRDVLPDLLRALENCGCWLLERKPLSLTQMQFRFDVQLGGVLDLYAALIGAGLEMTRGTHLEFTGLCTLRQQQGRAGKDFGGGATRVLEACLEVSFLEELPLASGLMPEAGTA